MLEAHAEAVFARGFLDAHEGSLHCGHAGDIKYDRIVRALGRESPLPFFADESVHRAEDIPRLAGAFDGINIKLMKCGGIGEALRMIAVARAHGMRVMLGCMIESSIAITAAAHLLPLVDAADLDGSVLIANDPYVGAAMTAGRLVLPDGSGLGVHLRD